MCFCGKTVLLLCPTVDWALAEVWETKILWQVLSLQLNGGSYQYSARNSHFPLLETTHPKFRQGCLLKGFFQFHHLQCFIMLPVFLSLSPSSICEAVWCYQKLSFGLSWMATEQILLLLWSWSEDRGSVLLQFSVFHLLVFNNEYCSVFTLGKNTEMLKFC